MRISTALPTNDADGVGQSGVAPAIPADLNFYVRRIILIVAFARCEEEIGFDSVLFRVEIIVAAAKGIEGLVCSALDDAPRLHDQDLVCSPNRRKPVCDYKRRAPSHEVAQTLLNERLRFRVQAGSRLVK